MPNENWHGNAFCTVEQAASQIIQDNLSNKNESKRLEMTLTIYNTLLQKITSLFNCLMFILFFFRS